MANIKSVIKRMRQAEKRREYNRLYISRARTFVKKARAGIQGSDVNAAREAVRLAVRDLDMAASRGVIHPRNAARRKSRLMRQLHAMSAQGTTKSR
jgi:small subunit ribosomal protein S20